MPGHGLAPQLGSHAKYQAHWTLEMRTQYVLHTHTIPQLSLVSNLNSEDNHTHGQMQIECDVMMTDPVP